MSRRLPNGERRISPTPSEQSFQTTVTNPASLFSVSQADGISDSISLVTTAGHDALIWERHPRAAMPVGYTMVRVQHPGFAQSSVPGQSQSHQQPSEMNLFEFLKEGRRASEASTSCLNQYCNILWSFIILSFQRLSRSTVGRASVGSRLRGHQTDSELSPYHHSIRSNEDEDGADWNADRTNGASMRSSRALCRNGRAAAGDGHGLFNNKPPVYRVIDPDQIELGTSLGEGEFGRVYQGVWRPDSGCVIQVAVKILNPHGLVENPSGFLNEIAVMHRINHPDIVHLYGVCMEPDSWKIVTELAPLRSLLECLREPELRSSFPVTTLHQFAVQITRGMSYLEEIGLVHRDLAARNILVFSKEMVKISDFGMSRALHLGKSYYQSNFNVNLKLPTAWCAPECIHDLCFTTASDVWAYAVTLWEMYTYGFTPWAGLTGRQILETIDTPRSGRLDQPDACPDAVYDAVMRACWAHEPTARPSFGQLLGAISIFWGILAFFMSQVS
ncbi:Tyrosine-protein kinase PR2 [Fasciola gigantica]|uniref:non-specific protein-tyrosine kinase n=1 Tax=Fasciola gigantica TaxID=46835 RepID=A0A504YU60_FASGI|nr:Tyrosine-protein kinase PR2 [Fasciola gigantica]